MINLYSFYYSCVDETGLCKGTPICLDMRDLKWCKSDTNWDISNAYSISPPTMGPLIRHVKCILQKNSTNKKTNGQWINKKERGDGKVFHCLNRGDENPFSEAKKQNEPETGVKKNWMEWMKTPCPFKYYRRCLGNRPDQCVESSGKC